MGKYYKHYNYYHCPYKNCNLNCRDKIQHKARYAKINCKETTSEIVKENKYSKRINYEALKKLYSTELKK